MGQEDTDTEAWREAQDIRCLPVEERITLASHNRHMGKTPIDYEKLEHIRERTRNR